MSEGKPKFRGFRALVPEAISVAAAPVAVPDASFEHFSFGPEGVRARDGPGGFSNFDDLLGGMFGGFANAPRVPLAGTRLLSCRRICNPPATMWRPKS